MQLVEDGWDVKRVPYHKYTNHKYEPGEWSKWEPFGVTFDGDHDYIFLRRKRYRTLVPVGTKIIETERS